MAFIKVSLSIFEMLKVFFDVTTVLESSYYKWPHQKYSLANHLEHVL